MTTWDTEVRRRCIGASVSVRVRQTYGHDTFGADALGKLSTLRAFEVTSVVHLDLDLDSSASGALRATEFSATSYASDKM